MVTYAETGYETRTKKQTKGRKKTGRPISRKRGKEVKKSHRGPVSEKWFN